MYRYLGTKDGSRSVEARPFKPTAGDRFLLCSDGVTDGCDADSLAKLLGDADDPQAAAEAVVRAAQAGGSRDNITCLVVFVET